MASNRNKKRLFNGMGYHEIQRDNSKNRSNLHKEDQSYLKKNDYKNVGWDSVISLYKKIEEFLDRYQLGELTLEELFLEADRIGNKYLNNEEREAFNQKLSKEVNEVAEEIDKQFPDTEMEIVDFSKASSYKSRNKRGKTKY